MKVWIIGCALLLCLAGKASAQDHLDWTACQKAAAQLKDDVAALQRTLPEGFHLELTCTYSGTKSETEKQPERHVELAKYEVAHLHELRRVADSAWSNLDAYEKLLIQRHGLPLIDYSDPCFRFVGIKLDDDFITDDPNPFTPWTCPATASR